MTGKRLSVRWTAERLTLLAAGAAISLVAAWHLTPSDWRFSPAEKDPTASAPAVRTGIVPAAREERLPPAPGTATTISAAPQPLLLTGTHVAADPRDSLAFLGVDPQHPQTYALGALLGNGARIASIDRTHVMLERDGASMRIDIGASLTAELSSPERAMRSVGGPLVAMAANPPASSEPIADYLRLSPEFSEAGTFAGYRLNPARDRSVFAEWGLEPDDRLVAVDGIALPDVDTAAELLRTVGAGGRIRGTVIRNGRGIEVILDGTRLPEAGTQRLNDVPPA